MYHVYIIYYIYFIYKIIYMYIISDFDLLIIWWITGVNEYNGGKAARLSEDSVSHQSNNKHDWHAHHDMHAYLIFHIYQFNDILILFYEIFRILYKDLSYPY